MSLRLPDSGAEVLADGRRVAPSAVRNAAPILRVLRRVVAPGARVLELASGTGQHAAEFAAALGAEWQPSDVTDGQFGSIAAWGGAVPESGVRPALVLDACAPGWGLGPWDAVVAVNLLHLVPEAGAEVLIAEAARALAPGGRLAIYGPFLREGRATSDGDAAFDADLRAQDAQLGYKDLGWVMARLGAAGLGVEVVPMPANNLMLLGFRV
jgi:SAM-dependent methyltransferase